MFRELKQKLIILENRKPYSSQTGEYIRELNMLDWIHSSLRLDGSLLARPETEKILKGSFIENASLNDHILIERYGDLVKSAENKLAMSYNLNKDMISSFNKILTGGDSSYRRENPILVSLSYNPPHPSEIEEQMDILMNWFYSSDMEMNPVRKAACLHLRIIEIYPFEEFSEATARAAMYYYLMENGFPPFEIRMKEQEYNMAVTEYLKRENAELFCLEAERSLLSKMEILIQLTDRKGVTY